MTEPDRGRLGMFFGVLLILVGIFFVVTRSTDASMLTLAPAYMFTPLIAGLVVCLGGDVSLSDVGLRVGRARWLVGSALVALPLVGVMLALSVAVPGIGFDPTADPVPGLELPPGIVGVLASFALVLALGATINALFAFGEEFGWRGYLLWELAPLGFWKASIGIGTIWGIWHAPVIVAGYNYPSFPVIGVAVMTVACIALSPAYTYLVIRAESVIAAALLHGVFNGSAGLVLVYTATDSTVLAELVANPVGVAGIVAFGLVAVGIALWGEPTLDRAFAGGNGKRRR